MNTNPLLLVAFEAVIWAPSGDQLDHPMINAVFGDLSDIPESSKKGTSRRILKRLPNLGLQLPIRRAPNFDTAVIRLCCQKLPNRVPTNALDKTVMLVNFTYSFFEIKNLVIQTEQEINSWYNGTHQEYNHSRLTPGNPGPPKLYSGPPETMQGQSHLMTILNMGGIK
jgi:hypothetical protein